MCEPDYCIIVSPLDKPRCFWGKQWGICLNKKKKELAKGLVSSSESLSLSPLPVPENIMHKYCEKTIQQHHLLILKWKIKIGRITDASGHTILRGILFGNLWENTKVTVSFHSCEKLYPKTAANHSINPIFITVISIDRKCSSATFTIIA